EAIARNKDNYNRGYFRRVITVNTPHWGASSAPFLITLAEICPKFNGVLKLTMHPVKLGAVADLNPSSFGTASMSAEASVRLPLNLPSAAVSSWLTMESEFSDDLHKLYDAGQLCASFRASQGDLNRIKTVLCGESITADDTLMTIAGKMF